MGIAVKYSVGQEVIFCYAAGGSVVLTGFIQDCVPREDFDDVIYIVVDANGNKWNVPECLIDRFNNEVALPFVRK